MLIPFVLRIRDPPQKGKTCHSSFHCLEAPLSWFSQNVFGKILRGHLQQGIKYGGL